MLEKKRKSLPSRHNPNKITIRVNARHYKTGGGDIIKSTVRAEGYLRGRRRKSCRRMCITSEKNHLKGGKSMRERTSKIWKSVFIAIVTLLLCFVMCFSMAACAGEPGPTGPQGAQGPAGPQGEPGSGRPSGRTRSCGTSGRAGPCRRRQRSGGRVFAFRRHNRNDRHRDGYADRLSRERRQVLCRLRHA